MKLVWLPRAIDNLDKIRQYIAQENPQAAQKVAQQIQQTVSHLKDHPQLGKPSLVDSLREIQVAKLPFTIPYKVINDTLIIARVFHNKQKPIYWEIS